MLATNSWVFIFKELNSNGKPVCYCHYGIELGFHIDTDSYMSTGSKIHPASDEQRDLLFQKMKDAGYKWYAEKKELKKPNTDFSDLRTWKYIVDAVWTEKEGIGQYLDSPFTEEVAKKLQKRFGKIEQKPAETEKGVKGNNREIPNSEKKPADKVDQYSLPVSDNSSLPTFDESIYHPCTEEVHEKKSSWSEEDEKQARQIERIVHDDGCTQKLQKQIADWFKSLKDRYTWKPSEEQMLALNIAIEMEDGDILKSLYQDLLKLKEE